MGNWLWFFNEQQEPIQIPSAHEIKALILLSINKLKLYKNKKIYEIKKRLPDIIQKLKENKPELVTSKMMLNIQDENMITVYDVLIPLCEIMKEKYLYLYNSEIIPLELKSTIDTIVYASTRLEIQELLTIRNALRLKFGDCYILKADANSSKLVNKTLVEKIGVCPISDLLINIRLKQLAKEVGISCNIPNIDYSPVIIPDDSWEVLYMDNDPMKCFNPTKSNIFEVEQNNDMKNMEQLDLKFNPYGSLFYYFDKEQVKNFGSQKSNNIFESVEKNDSNIIINESFNNLGKNMNDSSKKLDDNNYQYNQLKNKIDNLMVKNEFLKKSLGIELKDLKNMNNNNNNNNNKNTNNNNKSNISKNSNNINNINNINNNKNLPHKTTEGNQQAPITASEELGKISKNNNNSNKSNNDSEYHKPILNDKKDIIFPSIPDNNVDDDKNSDDKDNEDKDKDNDDKLNDDKDSNDKNNDSIFKASCNFNDFNNNSIINKSIQEKKEDLKNSSNLDENKIVKKSSVKSNSNSDENDNSDNNKENSNENEKESDQEEEEEKVKEEMKNSNLSANNENKNEIKNINNHKKDNKDNE